MANKKIYRAANGKFRTLKYSLLSRYKRADQSAAKRKENDEKRINKGTIHWNGWEGITEIKRSFVVKKGYKSSKKEIEIEGILNHFDIRFYREISFDAKKRFDFYLPDYDIIIEYDGWQHYGSFKQIANDELKDAILVRQGVRFIRYNYLSGDLVKKIRDDLKPTKLTPLI